MMAEKRDDKERKRGEAGMEREKECCLSLILQSVQTSRSLRCARWLLRRFVCFLRMEQLALTLRSCSTDWSKVHLHVQ